ncbi:MAG TPA: hypothetical protein VFD84_06005 [Candidatus Binatia bacterium]|nr:hypothetical protein [Candidatus Binatia bacterium]
MAAATKRRQGMDELRSAVERIRRRRGGAVAAKLGRRVQGAARREAVKRALRGLREEIAPRLGHVLERLEARVAKRLGARLAAEVGRFEERIARLEKLATALGDRIGPPAE